MMEQKSACHLSPVLSSAHRLLILENSRAAAVRERREGLEGDEAQVGKRARDMSLSDLSKSGFSLVIIPHRSD